MQKNNSNQLRLETLDGLRGIAIILVIYVHYWEITWLAPRHLEFLASTGSIGVSLFFFISGYCLHNSYSQRPSLGHYIWRRAIKILPSYWLCMAVILLFFNHTLSPNELTAWQIFTNLFFIHNWFAETYGGINGVFWTLAVEIQFYVLFPLIFVFFRRRPWLVTLCLLVLSNAYRWFFVLKQPDNLGFFTNQLPGFIEMFALGMLASELHKRPLVWLKPLIATLLALMATLMFLGLSYWSHIERFEPGITHWQAQYRTLCGISFFAVTLASNRASCYWRAVLANPFFTFMATISFNLYLWHQWLGRQLNAHQIITPSLIDPHTDLTWQLNFWLVAVLTSIGLASIITFAIERPLLNLRWGKSS